MRVHDAEVLLAGRRAHTANTPQGPMSLLEQGPVSRSTLSAGSLRFLPATDSTTRTRMIPCRVTLPLSRTGVLVGGLTALGVLWLLYVWVLRPRTRRGNRYLLVHRAHHTPQLDHQIKFW